MKKIFRNVKKFVMHYRQFSFAVLASVISLALTLVNQDLAARWILNVAVFAVAIPLFIGMIRDLREGTYGVDILAITAIVTAVIMNEQWAAIVIVLMLTGGEALEDYAENRAKREMTALLDNVPRRAHLLKGKTETEVSVKQVKQGDKIVVRPGEVVPVDAEIIEGSANFDEASLTGESVPEEKTVGSEILSGSINMDGTIVARALRAAADSQYEQIVKLVKSAAASKAPFVRMADRFAIPFTIISFAIAIGAWVISGDSMRFLQVMVVATPCPLILAAPIAIISGMSRASKAGIIVKNGTALERMANAKSFAFDKTGTLTHGQLAVSDIKPAKGFDKDNVLALAAALAGGSNHITSAAIVGYATKKALKTVKVKNIKEVSGKGMTAIVAGKNVLLGRPSFLEEQGVDVSESAKSSAATKTSTSVAIDGVFAGTIFFEDTVREDARSTIQYLRGRGIENTYLITGDNETVALSVAKTVGIPKADVVAHALPVDKLRTVERVAAAPVAFVGDGVNDAPVLVASDVGIALGAKGSTAASESADIVIMKDSLYKVADAHAIAKRTFKIARQSILLGIGMSVVLMLIFSTGRFSPVMGAAVQELVDVVVIFNALRAHVAGRRV